jgi:hypothetical protein
MIDTLVVIVIPLVLALAGYTVLRRRGTTPVRSGCTAVAAGVVLCLVGVLVVWLVG